MAYTRQRKIDENHVRQATYALFQQVLKDLMDGVIVGFEDRSSMGNSVWKVNMTFQVVSNGADSYIKVDIEEKP